MFRVLQSLSAQITQSVSAMIDGFVAPAAYSQPAPVAAPAGAGPVRRPRRRRHPRTSSAAVKTTWF